MLVELGNGAFQLFAELAHLCIERFDPVLTDEAHARLGIRKAHRLPVSEDLAAHRGDFLEGRMLGVEQLLARGEVVALGVEGLGGLALLLGREGLAHAQPLEGYADGGG